MEGFKERKKGKGKREERSKRKIAKFQKRRI